MRYNLSIHEAIHDLNEYVFSTIKREEPILDDIDNQTAFQLGAETVLQKLREMTGPDPMEVELIPVSIDEIFRAPVSNFPLSEENPEND